MSAKDQKFASRLMKQAIIKILEQNLSFEETAIELEKLMDIRMSELWREKTKIDENN